MYFFTLHALFASHVKILFFQASHSHTSMQSAARTAAATFAFSSRSFLANNTKGKLPTAYDFKTTSRHNSSKRHHTITTTSKMGKTILHLDSAMRKTDSASREITAAIAAKFADAGATVVRRDLLDNTPSIIDETWIGATFTPEEARSEEQKKALAESDALVAEIMAADVLVIGAPIYNFSIPGALKVWIDLIARAGVTFKYTPEGPVGLVEGKKAYVVYSSGGVPMGAAGVDHHTPLMKTFLGFIGITDVTLIGASGTMSGSGPKDAALEEVKKIDAVEVLA